MEPATVIGILLTALVTLLLAQVTGMRADLRAYQTEQKIQNEKIEREQKHISDRMTILETEHRSMACRRGGV